MTKFLRNVSPDIMRSAKYASSWKKNEKKSQRTAITWKLSKLYRIQHENIVKQQQPVISQVDQKK